MNKDEYLLVSNNQYTELPLESKILKAVNQCKKSTEDTEQTSRHNEDDNNGYVLPRVRNPWELNALLWGKK